MALQRFAAHPCVFTSREIRSASRDCRPYRAAHAETGHLDLRDGVWEVSHRHPLRSIVEPGLASLRAATQSVNLRLLSVYRLPTLD